MRKILLFAATVLLTGCEMINFTKESHEPGLNTSVSTEPKIIQYFEGDSISKTSLTAHEITFDVDEDEVVIDEQEPEKVKDFVVDNENIISSVDTAIEVSTFHNFEENQNLNDGLKVGFSSDLVSGYLSFTFTCKVKACEVFAYPRYGVKYLEEGSNIEIDANAAISANGSRFVKLKINDDFAELEESTCSFNFANEEHKLDLCVYGKRAVITKIVVYS